MFIISMGLISLGYVLMYWGLDNAVAWRSKDDFPSGATSLSNGTDAVELPILFGLPYQENIQSPQKTLVGMHQVPFPYYPTTSDNKPRPASNPGTPV